MKLSKWLLYRWIFNKRGGIIVKPNATTDGTTASGAAASANWDTIYAEFNGNIDNNNVKANAGIASSKLALITAAGKVDGSAITNLANIPSGAGNIPIANMPTGTYANIASTTITATIITVTSLTVTNLQVSQGQLKTTTGSVSHSSNSTETLDITLGSQTNNTNFPASYTTLIGGNGTSSGRWMLTLPGGQYGFTPQSFYSSSNIYFQQLYVTASGQDMWIFLLVDKVTKEITASYQAPDHPAYGNGGDFNQMPQPFINYDNTKYDVILLDQASCDILMKDKQDTGKPIVALISERYSFDTDSQPYVPLHSGKFIDSQPEMVETLPDFITVKGLVKNEKVTDQLSLG